MSIDSDFQDFKLTVFWLAQRILGISACLEQITYSVYWCTPPDL